MEIQDIALWGLAIALIIHTIDEAWLSEVLGAQADWRSLVLNPAPLLENFPIFVFAIAFPLVGWRLPLWTGILPAVGLTHPLLDHLGLSWKTRSVRPGSWTGLLLLLPLSIWVYGLGYTYGLFQPYEVIISGAIGLGISVWLFWTVDRNLP